MTLFKKFVYGFIFFLIISLSYLFSSFFIFINKPLTFPQQQNFYYYYHSGTRTQDFVHFFVSQNLVSQPQFFYALAFYYAHTKGLKAGEYLLKEGSTPLDIVEQISQGQVIKHKFTIVEGWTWNDIYLSLARQPAIQHLMTHHENTQQILTLLNIPHISPEGLFYPSTYEYTYGMSDLSILKRAYELMQRNINKTWAQSQAKTYYPSPYQALIVASLVEKETAINQEKPFIAGVILKRLKINMPLQIDPTVIYGLGAQYKGYLTSSDMKWKSPYNTYLHKGLPPSPICMPSLSSIQAAMSPIETNAIYYVAAGNGRHYFSTTFEEHQKAIKRYIALEKKYDSQIHQP